MTNVTSDVLCLAYFHTDEGSAFGRDLVGFCQKLLDEIPMLTRFDVLAGTPRPAAFSIPDEMELRSDDTPSQAYDGAFVVGGHKESVEIAVDRLRVNLANVHAYRVAEKVIFDREVAGFGSGPEITFLLNIKWFPDAPESVVRRSWQVHEPLAARVHVGSDRYVQWWVYESLDEDAPVVGGIVEMGFPSEVALVKGFFDSKRGEDEIVQDSAHFVAGGHPRLFVTTRRLVRSHEPNNTGTRPNCEEPRMATGEATQLVVSPFPGAAHAREVMGGIEEPKASKFHTNAASTVTPQLKH